MTKYDEGEVGINRKMPDIDLRRIWIFHSDYDVLKNEFMFRNGIGRLAISSIMLIDIADKYLQDI